MRGECSTFDNVPIGLILLKKTCKVKALEDDETFVMGEVILEVANYDCIGEAKDGESWELVVGPFSINIFSVGDVEEGGTIEFVVVPVGEVEGEVVVDKDTQSVSLSVGVRGALIFAIAIV